MCGEFSSLLSSFIIPWQPYINVGAAEHNHIDHVVYVTKSAGHVNDADKSHEACGWICIKFSPHPANDRADGIPGNPEQRGGSGFFVTNLKWIIALGC